MEAPRFNLLTNPWVRSRSLVDGQIETGSLAATLARAHEIGSLAGEVPSQDAAILRLLLAILRRSHPELRSREDWKRIWDAGRFDAEAIGTYLDRRRDRFDLLHPETPFFQVAGLTTAKGEMTDLGRLIADVPPGHQFFTTRSGRGVQSMSFAEAARWLVHCQAFDPSGIKSGAVGDDRVKGGRGYPIGIAWCGWLGMVIVEGRNLFETLMLNLQLPAGLPSPEVDQPVWERDPQGPGIEEGHQRPTGPADLLTWQSRRIRLGHDGEKVTGVLIANGDPLHPRNMFRHEFMTNWRLSEAQMKAQKSSDPIFMPRAHQPDRAVWRGLEGFLTQTGGGDGAISDRAGGWLEWLDELWEHEVLDETHPLHLRAVGMEYGAQSSVTADIIDDRLTVRLAVLTDPALRRLALDAVRDADEAVRALAQLAAELAEAAGASGDQVQSPRSSAREQGYFALDTPYRRWLASLAPDSDPEYERARWQAEARDIIRELGLSLVDGASDAAWSGREISRGTKTINLNAAVADNGFQRNLRRALELAYPTRTEGAPV